MSPTASTPVSCLLIDDHPAMIAAISRVLGGAGMRVVGTAASAAKGLELLRRRQADVAVVALELPDMDGIELARAIAKSPSPPRTLLYSGDTDPRLTGQALAAGVDGLIAKSSPQTEVVRAVRAIAAGGTYIDPLLGGTLEADDGRPALTGREEQLLEYLSNGLTDERIGEKLHLSSETVRANIRKVVRAMGARNRAHAVALALKRGVIQ